jgi:GTPase SAR1 family protein
MSAGSLQLVLFGLPSAGKSALLGALAEAARSQDTTLNGRLLDPSQTLAQLHKRLRENSSRPTEEETVPHPVTFEAAATPGKPAASREVVLVDTSGQAAANILQRSARGRLGSSSLAKAIGRADTLILVVDGSTEAAHLQRDFAQLAAFLRQFERTRGQRTEVGGLPVYLVLSKCDLLARKTDSTGAWMQRLEERKRQIGASFHSYLSREADRNGLPFGKLQLHVWATAVNRPALTDRPAGGHEPFGVAELFRQGLQAAVRFRERRQRAARRLKWITAGATGLVTVMVVLALGLYLSRPSAQVIALENAVHGLMPPQGAKPGERLKEPLDKKLDRLRQVQQSPYYVQLPASRRAAVDEYVGEIEAYLKYNAEFLKKVRDPRFATRLEDLAQIEKSLDAVALPQEYAAQWEDTRAGKRPRIWRNDIRYLRQQIAATESWINDQMQKGKDLKMEGYRLLGTAAPAKERAAWLEKYKKYAAEDYPHRPGRLLPGASSITYETVYRFERVVRARQAWDDFKRSLRESVYKDLQEMAVFQISNCRLQLARRESSNLQSAI